MDSIHPTGYGHWTPLNKPKTSYYHLFINLTKINNIDPISYGFWTPQNEAKTFNLQLIYEPHKNGQYTRHSLYGHWTPQNKPKTSTSPVVY